MAAIYSRSSRCERRPRRSCVAAETGRGTAFALGFPIGGSLRCPCSIGNEIHTACGRYPALPDDIHACGVDDICEPGLANDEAPKPFRFRGFIYPGSYLLSRDLSSDYHRRADVSLPGSEWDRVGPSGYDHQALARLSYLPGYHFCGGFLFLSGRLTSAWLACFCSAPSFLHA